MSIKKLITLPMILLFILLNIGFTVAAEWQIDDITRNQYYYQNGEMLKDCISRIETQENGTYAYKFDKDGICQGLYTGWTKTKSGEERYYYQGYMKRDGWKYIKGLFYNFDNDGVCTGDQRESIQKIEVDVIYKDNEISLDITHLNMTDEIIWYTYGYDNIEILIDGKWVTARFEAKPDGMGLIEPAVGIQPNKPNTETIVLTDMFINIESGIYRIVSNMDYSEPFEIKT